KYAPMSAWTCFWLYMGGVGKVSFYVITSILVVGFLVLLPVDDSPFVEQFKTTFIIWLWGGGAAAVLWLVGSLVVAYVPDVYIYKPSRKGPVWEMNRQTGLVTVFARKKGRFRKYGVEGDFIAPFYEFDAAIHTIPDRQGLPWNMLNLLHRYTPVGIDFSVVMGKQRLVEPCMAMWDFWQRYMDISQPLPDIPVLEQYRHLDPTTAEYDRRNARPPRFWRDMDEKTFDKKLKEIGDTSSVNMNRPDLMWRYRPAG